MEYICEESVNEPLILERDDWSEDEWATIVKLAGLEEAERIVFSNYKFEAWGKAKTVISDEQWDKALEHLRLYITEYACIGMAGRFGLDGVLLPLLRRYESGERTGDLYRAMLEVE